MNRVEIITCVRRGEEVFAVARNGRRFKWCPQALSHEGKFVWFYSDGARWEVHGGKALLDELAGVVFEKPPRVVELIGGRRSNPELLAKVRRVIELAQHNPDLSLSACLTRAAITRDAFNGHTRVGGALRGEYEAAMRSTPMRREWRKWAARQPKLSQNHEQ